MVISMELIQNEKLRRRYLESSFYRQFFRESLDGSARLLRAESGEIIIRQAETAGNLYVLMDGRCSVSQLLPNGRTVILHTEAAPCLLGEIELLQQQDASMTVKALRDCSLISLPLNETRGQLINDNSFLRNLCIYITGKEARNSRMLFETFAYPLENRMAKFILDNLEGDEFRVRKVYAADSLGVSYRQTENVMRKFVDGKILRKQGLVYTVLDWKRLQALCRDMKISDHPQDACRLRAEQA